MVAKRVAVVGGGISGLSAAWNLLKGAAPVKVTIYEASPRVGGWIRSVRNKGGGVFEFGPRSLRATGPAARCAMEVVRIAVIKLILILDHSNHSYSCVYRVT